MPNIYTPEQLAALQRLSDYNRATGDMGDLAGLARMGMQTAVRPREEGPSISAPIPGQGGFAIPGQVPAMPPPVQPLPAMGMAAPPPPPMGAAPQTLVPQQVPTAVMPQAISPVGVPEMPKAPPVLGASTQQRLQLPEEQLDQVAMDFLKTTKQLGISPKERDYDWQTGMVRLGDRTYDLQDPNDLLRIEGLSEATRLVGPPTRRERRAMRKEKRAKMAGEVGEMRRRRKARRLKRRMGRPFRGGAIEEAVARPLPESQLE